MLLEEFSVTTIGQLAIYTNPNAKADPLLAVQSLPASTSADETANVSLRGSPPNETGIFLNNVPVKDAVRLDQINGIGQFSIFNTALLQSVHVFPSNPPIEFGNAGSGAVVMNTSDKLPQKINSITLTLAGAGIYGSRKIGTSTGITLFANTSSQEGLKSLNQKALGRMKSFTSVDGGLQIVHQFKEQARLKIFNYALVENYAYRYQHPSYNGLFKQQKKRNMSIVNYQQQWSNSQLEINQLYDWSTTDFSFGNLNLQLHSQNTYSSINYQYFNEKSSIKTGVSFDHHREVFDAVYPLYQHALAPTHPIFPYDTTTTITVPETYIYGKTSVNKIQIGGGFRYHPSWFAAPAWLSGQLNFRLKLSESHRVLLSTGNYHQMNVPKENAADIFKISTRHYALEYGYDKGNWELASSIYYKKTLYKAITNPIIGAELFAAWKFPQFKGSLSFAHIHSMLEEGTQSIPSKYDFDYFLRLMAQYDLLNWCEISLVYLHRQGQVFEPLIGKTFHTPTATWQPWFAPRNQTNRLPSYRIIDVSISKIVPLGEGALVLFLSANNVLDTKNIRGYSYDFEYIQQTADLYNQRVVFVGGVWSF